MPLFSRISDIFCHSMVYSYGSKESLFDIFIILTMKVGVHIADVTHFIKPGTNIDDEALKRGTSVYLSDKVRASFFHNFQ